HVDTVLPCLAGRPRTAAGGDGLAPVVPLGLHEEGAARRVSAICGRRVEDSFSVAGQLDVGRVVPVVGHRDPTDLGRVVGCGRDFGPGLDVAASAVYGHQSGRQGG